MQLLKLLLVFVLSFEAISAAAFENEKKVSFSVEKVWQSYKKKDNCCKCKCDVEEDTWREGVQECFDGVRNVAGKFRGKAYDLADTVIASFEQYLTKLIYFSNTNSTVLQSSSEVILGLVAKCNKLNESPDNVLREYAKVLPEIFEGFTDVAQKLSPQIGELTCSFNEGVKELGCVLSKFMREFLLSCRLTGCKTKVDYEPTQKKLQKVMNTVALIAERTQNNCEAKPEVQEAVAVLSLIFWCLTIVVQGMNSCAMQVLLDNTCAISQTTTSVSISYFGRIFR